MATNLPHSQITPIPDTEPEAVPSLWNTRYEEIDQNFSAVKSGLNATETELAAARGEKPSLAVLLEELIQNVEGLDPDFQNTLVASIMQALNGIGLLNSEILRIEGKDEGYGADYQNLLHYFVRNTLESVQLAHKEIQKTRDMRIQEGVITFKNRGFISGCTITKSLTAARNVSLAAGTAFFDGRSFAVEEMVNSASIPGNSTGETKTCYVFLWKDSNGVLQCDATELGQPVPDYGVTLYEATVPAGSTDITDPFLASVTLTDRRRLEPDWPRILIAPTYAYIALPAVIPGGEYGVFFDIVSYQGARPPVDAFEVAERATNGFKVYYGGLADTVVVRYRVIRMNS